MRLLLAFVLMLFSAGCVSVPKLPESPGERITVEYDPGPFCGSCDNMKIVANSDGKAIWVHGFWQGNYTDWTENRYSVRFSPEQFETLRDALAQFRPKGDLYFGANSKTKTCEVAYFDMPSRRIEWQNDQGTDRLSLDLGCDPERHAELLKVLEELPSRLGIKNPPKADEWVATTRAQ